MAMGTDGQQVIHPFFRQEFGVSVKSKPSNEPVSPANTHVHELRPISSQSSTHEQGLQVLENCGSNVPKINNGSSVNLDEDLNEDRRKRRRTDTTQTTEPTTTSSAGLSEWLGYSVTNNNPSSTDHSLETEIKLPIPQPELPPAETQIPADETRLLAPAEKEKPEGRVARTSARQKTLRLNSKGGFLSSPASSPPRETRNRAPGKRGRPRKAVSKVATIKYSVTTENNLGKLIDDILDGRVVQKPPRHYTLCSAAQDGEPTQKAHTSVFQQEISTETRVRECEWVSIGQSRHERERAFKPNYSWGEADSSSFGQLLYELLPSCLQVSRTA
ncbi:hypothetical protein N7497_010424 [Penicillium chrysogenum]|nr:hypothetical protein N7497_010424 [Penicillium chrysogenum]